MKEDKFFSLRKTIVIVAVGFSLAAAGFMAGKTAQAESTTPGTTGDPLVSQSYVQAQVNAKTKELQQKISQLETKAANLEAQIKALEQK